MVLLAHLYHDPSTPGNASYIKAFLKAVKTYLPKTRQKAYEDVKVAHDRKGAPYLFTAIEIRALKVAHHVARTLNLDYENDDYLFATLPWSHPGECVELTEDCIKKIAKLSA